MLSGPSKTISAVVFCTVRRREGYNLGEYETGYSWVLSTVQLVFGLRCGPILIIASRNTLD